jgi:C4-type Zn-finger protein
MKTENNENKALNKTDVSSSFIFDKYLKDECPVCEHYVDGDSFYSHKENGGKLMAMYFKCRTCGSEYTIGLNRSREPISSEITFNSKVE